MAHLKTEFLIHFSSFHGRRDEFRTVLHELMYWMDIRMLPVQSALTIQTHSLLCRSRKQDARLVSITRQHACMLIRGTGKHDFGLNFRTR